jgi:hypothetical protein
MTARHDIYAALAPPGPGTPHDTRGRAAAARSVTQCARLSRGQVTRGGTTHTPGTTGGPT